MSNYSNAIKLTTVVALILCSISSASKVRADGSSQGEGPTEEFATAEAMRKKPTGADIESSTCKTIDIANNFRYRCTVKWKTKTSDQ